MRADKAGPDRWIKVKSRPASRVQPGAGSVLMSAKEPTAPDTGVRSTGGVACPCVAREALVCWQALQRRGLSRRSQPGTNRRRFCIIWWRRGSPPATPEGLALVFLRIRVPGWPLASGNETPGNRPGGNRSRKNASSNANTQARRDSRRLEHSYYVELRSRNDRSRLAYG